MRADFSEREAASRSPSVERFLAVPDPVPQRVRAFRHLEVRSDHLDEAWLDVWTELDGNDLRYDVIREGGSSFIRHHVLRAALKSESDLRRSGSAERANFTLENYNFEDRGLQPDGLISLGVKPRKKDVLFLDGSLFLTAGDADLVRLEGRLAKSPSFWASHVEITGWFRRVAGFRLPVAYESVANVWVVGRSTFRMSFEYETVNGVRVGDPQVQHRVTQMR